MRRLFIAVVIFGGMLPLDLQAQTLFIRGRRGPIVRNDSSRVGSVRTLRGAPNLVFFNGGVAERDRNGRLNRLSIDRRTGRLIGAREGGTAQQLSNVLAQMRNQFRGRARQAIDAFLRRTPPNLAGGGIGIDPTGGIGGGAPRVPPGGGKVAIDKGDGKHGQGSRVDTTPKGGQGGAPKTDRPIADGGSGIGAGACRDLNAAICGAGDAQNKERQADEFKSSTVRAFLKQSRLDGRTFGGVLGGILSDPNRFGNIYRAFTSFLSGRMGADVKSALGKARSSLLTAIEGTPFSADAKSKLRSKLSGVTFRVTPNFASFQSLRAFVENCGPEGMGDGAFAVPGLNEVVICPGLVFGGQGRGGDLASHVAHVLAHEMGHHAGADQVPGSPTGFGAFKSLYGSMEKCYLAKFDGLGARRMGEVTADTWGVEAVAVQLRGRSQGEALSFLRNTIAPLCGTPASPEHPPGAFRINVTLGRNPRIRDALGCPGPTSERPACTFAGRVPEN